MRLPPRDLLLGFAALEKEPTTINDEKEAESDAELQPSDLSDESVPTDPASSAEEITDEQQALAAALMPELQAFSDAMNQDGSPAFAIGALCAKALEDPARLVPPVSDHLVVECAGRVNDLAEGVPPRFLVAELSCGASAVALQVIPLWVDQGQAGKLMRLADSLSDVDGGIHNPEATEIFLGLATGLGITGPHRAERLIAMAAPLVVDDGQRALLRTAKERQAIGDFLLEGGRGFQAFWKKAVSRSGGGEDWSQGEAAGALAHLITARASGRAIPTALRRAVPDEVWNASVKRADKSTAAPPSPPAPEPVEDEADEAGNGAAREREPVNEFALNDHKIWEPPTHDATPKTLSPRAKQRRYLTKNLVVGAVIMLGLCVFFFIQSRRPPPKPTSDLVTGKPDIPLPDSSMRLAMHEPAIIAPLPPLTPIITAPPAETSIHIKPQQASLLNTSVSDLATKPMPMPVVAAPAPVVTPPVKSDPPPAETTASQEMKKTMDASSPSVTRAHDEWRLREAGNLLREHPGAARWRDRVKHEPWGKTRMLLMGMETYLPYESEEYAQTLRLLQLDPPADPEVREAVSKIAVRRFKPSEIVPLWEHLVYPGSPNGTDIRKAASIFLDAKEERLTPDYVERLRKLAGGE